jgi:hypothetical protein
MRALLMVCVQSAVWRARQPFGSDLPAGMSATWSLSSEQRASTLQRISASICCLAHSRGQEIPEDVAYESSVSIELKAYTAAQVASNVTTGSRPLIESTKAYARCACSLACSAAVPPAPPACLWGIE